MANISRRLLISVDITETDQACILVGYPGARGGLVVMNTIYGNKAKELYETLTNEKLKG